jgi:hypothetical protein
MKGFEILAIAPYVGKVLHRIGYVLVSGALISFTASFLILLIPLGQLYYINFGTSVFEFSTLNRAYRGIFVLGVTGEHEKQSYNVKSNNFGGNLVEQLMFLILFLFVCLFSINMLIAVVTDKWSQSASKNLWIDRTNERLRMQVTLGLQYHQKKVTRNLHVFHLILRYIVKIFMGIFKRCYGSGKIHNFPLNITLYS